MGKTSIIWTEDKLITKDICFDCGSNDKIEYHHVVPETLGGTKTLPLCLICHGKVHDRDFVKHRELQRLGIERAKKEGKFMGRKPGCKESPEKFLNKKKNMNIMELVKRKYSYSKISEICSCSPTTIVKVVKEYKKINGENY